MIIMRRGSRSSELQFQIKDLKSSAGTFSQFKAAMLLAKYFCFIALYSVFCISLTLPCNCSRVIALYSFVLYRCACDADMMICIFIRIDLFYNNLKIVYF